MIDLVRAWMRHSAFQALPEPLKKRAVDKKLKKLIAFARQHSAYYHDIIPENWTSLSDIPLTTKKDVTAHFDDIVTDKRVTFESVNAFIQNAGLTEKLLGAYTVSQTSGSTGRKGVFLQDSAFSNASAASGSKIYKSPLALIGRKGRGILYEVGSSTEKDSGAYFQSRFFDCMIARDELYEQLNAYQPKCVNSYASEIDALSDGVSSGKLKIKPELLIVSGERLSGEVRKRIEAAFPTARLISVYACTEAGAIAYECPHHHLHIIEDLNIVEPIDENGNVLPFETVSHGVRLTNLNNHIQPLINYVLEDRVILHEHCDCGNKSPWVEVEGRQFGELVFCDKNQQERRISAFNLHLLIGNVTNRMDKDYKRYQIILHKNTPQKTYLECRLEFYEGADKAAAFERTKKAFSDYFAAEGIEVDIRLSEEPPQLTGAFGKHESVYMIDELKANQ